jgi:hypothetical protein
VFRIEEDQADEWVEVHVYPVDTLHFAAVMQFNEYTYGKETAHRLIRTEEGSDEPEVILTYEPPADPA